MVDDSLLADPASLIIRGGGWMRQTDDSPSMSAEVPFVRIYANTDSVAFQIHGRFITWFTSLTIDDPTRDSQGWLSVGFDWSEVSVVRLARRSLVVDASHQGAFCFTTRDRAKFGLLKELMSSVHVTVVPVRRTYTDFYRSTRRRR